MNVRITSINDSDLPDCSGVIVTLFISSPFWTSPSGARKPECQPNQCNEDGSLPQWYLDSLKYYEDQIARDLKNKREYHSALDELSALRLGQASLTQDPFKPTLSEVH